MPRPRGSEWVIPHTMRYGNNDIGPDEAHRGQGTMPHGRTVSSKCKRPKDGPSPPQLQCTCRGTLASELRSIAIKTRLQWPARRAGAPATQIETPPSQDRGDCAVAVKELLGPLERYRVSASPLRLASPSQNVLGLFRTWLDAGVMRKMLGSSDVRTVPTWVAGAGGDCSARGCMYLFF